MSADDADRETQGPVSHSLPLPSLKQQSTVKKNTQKVFSLWYRGQIPQGF